MLKQVGMEEVGGDSRGEDLLRITIRIRLLKLISNTVYMWV